MNQADDIDALQIGPDPDKLFVYHRRQLSAMLDGELSPDEAKFMLRRLQHDTELATCWERWQVCGDMLRGQRNALLPSDFAGRVALALAGGAVASAQAVPAPVQVRRPRLVRWGGGAAVAASVALLAVFAGRQLPEIAPDADTAASTPMVAAGPALGPAQAPVTAAVAGAAAPDAVADAGGRVPLPAPEAAAALATAALAVAEVPRRAAERRAPAQAQRTRAAGDASRQAPVLVAVATSPPAPELAAPAAVEGHFALPPASEVASRPWPRALMPTAGHAFTVGYGQLPREAGFEPFRPRDVLGAAPDAAVAPRVDAATGTPQRP